MTTIGAYSPSLLNSASQGYATATAQPSLAQTLDEQDSDSSPFSSTNVTLSDAAKSYLASMQDTAATDATDATPATLAANARDAAPALRAAAGFCLLRVSFAMLSRKASMVMIDRSALAILKPGPSSQYSIAHEATVDRARHHNRTRDAARLLALCDLAFQCRRSQLRPRHDDGKRRRCLSAARQSGTADRCARSLPRRPPAAGGASPSRSRRAPGSALRRRAPSRPCPFRRAASPPTAGRYRSSSPATR